MKYVVRVFCNTTYNANKVLDIPRYPLSPFYTSLNLVSSFPTPPARILMERKEPPRHPMKRRIRIFRVNEEGNRNDDICTEAHAAF